MPPSYHITTVQETGALVLLVRHALAPHDVVGRVEFSDAAKMRDVAEFMIESADAIDLVAKIPRDELLAGHNRGPDGGA